MDLTLDSIKVNADHNPTCADYISFPTNTINFQTRGVKMAAKQGSRRTTGTGKLLPFPPCQPQDGKLTGKILKLTPDGGCEHSR